MVEPEGEINIDIDTDMKDETSKNTESSLAPGAPAAAASSNSSVVDSWSANDSTLLDLFDQAANTYDAAHESKTEGESPRKKQRTGPSNEQTREATYANYPPKPHTAVPANVSTPVPPAQQSSATNAKSSQHTPASTGAARPTTGTRISPNPNYKGSNYRPDFVHPHAQSGQTTTSPIVHTVERTIGTPSGNKQVAALVKQRVQGRATGSPQQAASVTGGDNHSPAPAAAAASTSIPGSLAQQWAPPSFPHGAPPPPPLMPMGMPPGAMPHPSSGLPPTHEAMMEDASLTNLLLSWYYAGYYTGQHQARKAMQAQSATLTDGRTAPSAENGVAGTKRKLQQ